MNEQSFDYINVIPLVDVMLVLLTIVLTGATFVASGSLPIELPHACTGQEQAVPRKQKRSGEAAKSSDAQLTAPAKL